MLKYQLIKSLSNIFGGMWRWYWPRVNSEIVMLHWTDQVEFYVLFKYALDSFWLCRNQKLFIYLFVFTFYKEWSDYNLFVSRASAENFWGIGLPSSETPPSCAWNPEATCLYSPVVKVALTLLYFIPRYFLFSLLLLLVPSESPLCPPNLLTLRLASSVT